MERRIKYLEKLCAEGGYTAGVRIIDIRSSGETLYHYINYPVLKRVLPLDTSLYQWLEFRCLEEEFMRELSLEIMNFYGPTYSPSFDELSSFLDKNKDKIAKKIGEE